MAVKIVKKDERLSFEVEGSTFHYRRISSPEQNRIVTKHTKKGRQNWERINNDFIEIGLLGWDNVEEEETQIEFSFEDAKRLPSEVIDEFLLRSGAARPEGATKNLKSSSSSK